LTKYLLDTTILIEHLRGKKPAANFITEAVRHGHKLGICCINVAELYSGLSHEQAAQAEKLTNALDYYEATADSARQAGVYRYEFARRGVSLSVTDTLVAAIAKANDAIVVTANVRDYPMKDIQVQQYLTGL
jgi:predicted nucleic acid-binding protein